MRGEKITPENSNEREGKLWLSKRTRKEFAKILLYMFLFHAGNIIGIDSSFAGQNGDEKDQKELLLRDDYSQKRITTTQKNPVGIEGPKNIPTAKNGRILKDIHPKLWEGGCIPTVASMIVEGVFRKHGIENPSVNPGDENWKETIEKPFDRPVEILPDCSEVVYEHCGKPSDLKSMARFLEVSVSAKNLAYGFSYITAITDGSLLEGIIYFANQNGFEAMNGRKLSREMVEISGFIVDYNHDVVDFYYKIKKEIDRGNAMIGIVETAQGLHSVAIIGYQEVETDSGEIDYYYACYDTWYLDIRWVKINQFFSEENQLMNFKPVEIYTVKIKNETAQGSVTNQNVLPGVYRLLLSKKAD